jgi:hypothetical protein
MTIKPNTRWEGFHFLFPPNLAEGTILAQSNIVNPPLSRSGILHNKAFDIRKIRKTKKKRLANKRRIR